MASQASVTNPERLCSSVSCATRLSTAPMYRSPFVFRFTPPLLFVSKRATHFESVAQLCKRCVRMYAGPTFLTQLGVQSDEIRRRGLVQLSGNCCQPGSSRSRARLRNSTLWSPRRVRMGQRTSTRIACTTAEPSRQMQSSLRQQG